MKCLLVRRLRGSLEHFRQNVNVEQESRVRSKLMVAVVGAASLLLSLIVVMGVAASNWLLVAVAGVTLVNGTLLISLDAWRRGRMTRNVVRNEIRQLVPPKEEKTEAPPLLNPTDLVGTVQILQAQYVGRLDRMQASLDHAIKTLAERSAVSDDHSSDEKIS